MFKLIRIFERAKQVLRNLIRLKDPRIEEIYQFGEYDLSNCNVKEVLEIIRKFKYNRTYFMDWQLEPSKQWIDWNGDLRTSTMVWIQRISSIQPYFLIFDDFKEMVWKRISDEALAKFILDGGGKIEERSLLEVVKEGKGFNED